MGSENLHHIRKARSAADLRRKRARKNPYKRILIVCEGEATEINYFNGLISELRLGTANAIAVPSPSTCPSVNVAHGLERYNTGDWDIVFCVFDRDRHGRFDQAVRRLEDSPAAVRPGYSVPCFEYWLLLHFIYTNKSFYGHPTQSAGKCAEDALKTHIPTYRKGARDIYRRTSKKLETAKEFAKRANKSALEADHQGSYTFVVDVVEELQTLRALMDT